MYEKVTIKEKVGYYSDNRNIHAKSNNKDYKLISKLIFFRWFFFFPSWVGFGFLLEMDLFCFMEDLLNLRPCIFYK